MNNDNENQEDQDHEEEGLDFEEAGEELSYKERELEIEDEQEEPAAESEEPQAPRKPNTYVTDPLVETLEDVGYSEAEFIALPPASREVISERFENIKQVDDEFKTPEAKKWIELVKDSMNLFFSPGVYKNLLHDPNRTFRQGFRETDNEDSDLLNIGAVKLREKSGDVKGQTAVALLANKLKLGTLTRIPLYHSGIWVMVRPPSERDLIRFYHNLMNTKVNIGRISAGFIFSHYSVYLAQSLFEFIIDHIHACSVQGLTKDDYKNMIHVQDLPLLAWGFAAAIYPDGFEYSRGCINTPDEEDGKICKKISQGKVNVSKLLWFDDSVLTPEQRRHMADFKTNSKTVKDVEAYCAAFNTSKSKKFIFNVSGQEISFHLKTPTVSQYFSAGTAWVDYIVNQVENVIMANVTGDEEEVTRQKDELTENFVKSSLLRRYEHFIEKITIDDLVVSDSETIPEILDLLSSEKELVEKYQEIIDQHLSEITYAIVGIPTYQCECGMMQKDENPYPRFEDVIAVDPFDLFFVLATLRTSRILRRTI